MTMETTLWECTMKHNVKKTWHYRCLNLCIITSNQPTASSSEDKYLYGRRANYEQHSYDCIEILEKVSSKWVYLGSCDFRNTFFDFQFVRITNKSTYTISVKPLYNFRWHWAFLFSNSKARLYIYELEVLIYDLFARLSQATSTDTNTCRHTDKEQTPLLWSSLCESLFRTFQ